MSITPRNQSYYRLKKQTGSALVMAVFIIIVISLLAASLVSFQRDSAESTSYEVYAARAYLAAYSAGEIALMDLFPLGSTEASTAHCTNTEETPEKDLVAETVTLPTDDDTAGFHGCSAEYICSVTSSAVATRYKVVSTAVCKNSQITTRRQITVEATSL